MGTRTNTDNTSTNKTITVKIANMIPPFVDDEGEPTNFGRCGYLCVECWGRAMPGLSGVLLCGVTGCDAKYQIHSLLPLAGCDEHHARIALKRIQPVRQICRAVVDGSILDTTVPRKKCGAHLGNEFLSTVVVVSEAFGVRQTGPVETRRVPRCVRKFMEER